MEKAGLFVCLAMNPDKLVGDEVCASSSNRTLWEGRVEHGSDDLDEPDHGCSGCGRRRCSGSGIFELEAV